MTLTLTDRYIDAAVRTLPTESQEDVRAELAAAIADNIEARTQQGDTHEHAERVVLTDLGDPDVLAASYAERPLQLIGPKYYLLWWRLLKLLLVIVPVTGAAGVAIAKLLTDAPIGDVIGSVLAVAVGAIVHVAFWTTLVFAILERTGADTGVRWSLDNLPEPRDTGAGRGDLIGSLVFIGLMAAALLWDRFIGFVFIADRGLDLEQGLGAQTSAMSVLNPELWPFWLSLILVLLGLEAALAVSIFARRGWNVAFASLNTVLAVAFAALFLTLLLAGKLLNPELVHYVLGRGDVTPETVRILAIVLGVAVVVVATLDIAGGWRKASRSRATRP